jgi:lysozyme family protein
MAKLQVLAPFILSWEGGFVDDPDDSGGATNRGVTIATWRQVGYDKDGDGDIDVDDLKLITANDATERVMRPHSWNRWHADQIRCQSIANSLVDWVWASGKWGIVYPQELLGVTKDGIVGQKTLDALNAQDPRKFFERLQARRRQYLYDNVRKVPKNQKFLKGWLRRLEYIQYGSLTYNTTPKPEVHKFTDI